MLRGRMTGGEATDYPDPLGYLTGGARTTIGVLQCAVGTSPSQVATGQPFEVLVVVEQISDQPVRFTATLKPPYRHLSGARASFITPQLTLDVILAPGECVLLHFPAVAQEPTPAGEGYLFGVQFQFNTNRFGRIVRDPLGGRAPTVFAQSPLRMQILRDNVTFSRVSNLSASVQDTIQATVAVLPGEIHDPRELTARIDQIWVSTLIGPDRAQAADLMARTATLASQFTIDAVYEPLRQLTTDRFLSVGLPLLPGESDVIAKAMTHALCETEPTGDRSQAHMLWFRHLSYFAHLNQIGSDPSPLLDRLFAPILYDAACVGWGTLAAIGGSALDPAEAERQAALVLEAWTTRKLTAPTLYLPLVMAGVRLLAHIRSPQEKVWQTLNTVRDAWRVREPSLTTPPMINTLMPKLFTLAEQDLISMRIVPN